MSEPITHEEGNPVVEGSEVKAVDSVEQYDDQVDSSVYKRDQKSKWRSRAEDNGEAGDNKRQKRQREFKVTEFTPRVDENGVPLPRSERKPKKKVACLIGYCGTGYNGMQLQPNPDVKTIEGEIFKAFAEAGAISPENTDDLKKNGFMRAARTDKGVHAAGNVISCKLIIEDPDIKDKINAALPDQIRVWGIQRTSKSFDCRRMCSSRIYEYLLPTYTLLPPKPGSVLANLIKSKDEVHPNVIRDDVEGKTWWEETKQAIIDSGLTEDDITKIQQLIQGDEQIKPYDSEGKITENGRLIKSLKSVENSRRRDYKVSPERLELFRQAMQQYEGSHNFHNFTLGKAFKDASARRYMLKTTVSDPFVIQGTEWVSIKIHGQSFMLHQIRKMIAMAVLVIRTGCPISRIQDCYGPTKINIPKAPALGLLLENPVYEAYNQILEKNNYEHIDFSIHQKEMDEFKMKFIYDKIYSEEVKENAFYGFFGFIDTFRMEADKEDKNVSKQEVGHVFDFLGATFDNGLDDGGKVKEAIEEDDKKHASMPKVSDNVD